MKIINTIYLLVGGAFTVLPSTSFAQTTPCGQGDDKLYCLNDSRCFENQSPDFEDFELPDGSYHEFHQVNSAHLCECKPGWTGVECNVPIVNCDDGEHFCLHGGYCVPDGLYCDCSGAVNVDGDRYVGKWCEHLEEGHCNKEDRFSFCLHGGTCNPGFPEDGSGEPCFCEEGFNGPHCEYKESHEYPPLDMCDSIFCENGGICKLGMGAGLDDEYLDFYDNDDYDDEDQVYCECPKGFHGEFCEVESELCGEDRCYNGGECVSKPKRGPNGEETDERIFHCDCSTAGDEETKYAGQYCQYESEVFCTENDSLHGHLFCVNGGECQTDEPYLGCKCPKGFRGFACEYWVGNANATHPGSPAPGQDEYIDSVCDLDCGDHGKCKKGIKDITSLGTVAHGNYLNETFKDEFEHCICEPGYVGLECEHRIDTCSEEDFFDTKSHFCLHGGSCVGNDADGFSCDCSSASSNELDSTLFMGDHCEHPSVSCHDVERVGGPTSFCSNGGTCIDIIEANDEAHPGCNCTGGWIGDYCDVWAATLISDPVEEKSDSMSTREITKIFIVVLFVISFTIFGFVMATRRRYYKETGASWDISPYTDTPDQSKNLSPHREGGNYTSPSSRDPMAAAIGSSGREEGGKHDGKVYLGPPRDEDGNQLEDISII